MRILFLLIFIAFIMGGINNFPTPPLVAGKPGIYHIGEDAARTYDISWDWFYRVVEAESRWGETAQVGDGKRGRFKSYGLCQIQIATARSWGRWKGSDNSIRRRLLHPAKNLWLCARILRNLKRRYGTELLASAAFNSGHKHAEYLIFVTKGTRL